MRKNLLITLSLIALSGCSKSSHPADGGFGASNESKAKSWTATKSNVPGLYFYSRGAGTMDESTLDLLHGGSYILKDMMLPNGTSYGNWSVNGDNEITLFTDGMKVGNGDVYKDRIVLGNKTYKKQ